MEDTIQIFSEYKHFSVLVHVFSVIVGMGTALISDILFNFYIKDKKINPTENNTLKLLSTVIWISLAVIVLSGLAIFLSDPFTYAHSAKFLAKMSIVLVIILNGLLFWKITHKTLKKINFTDTNSRHKYVRVRKMSFAFGAVSMVSWLVAFGLASIPTIPVSYPVVMGIYAVVVVGALVSSQIVEYIITHRK